MDNNRLACIFCGNGPLHLDESMRAVKIGDKGAEVPFRIHWCESCGIEMALNEDLRFNARAMRQARTGADYDPTASIA
jgi:hypothetical protein